MEEHITSIFLQMPIDLQRTIQCYSPESCILLQINYSTVRSWWQKWQRWWLFQSHCVLRVKMVDTGVHWQGWNKMSNSCTLTKIYIMWILPYYSPQGLLTCRSKKIVIPNVSRIENKSENSNNSKEIEQQILAFIPLFMGYF
jgi:hypothetical protein